MVGIIFLTWMLWISLLSLFSHPCLQQYNVCLFVVLAFKALFTLLMRNLLFSLVAVIMGLPSKKTIDKTKVSLWLGVFQVEDISVKNCRLDVMKESIPAGFVCQGRELSVCCQETVTLALIMINNIHVYLSRFFSSLTFVGCPLLNIISLTSAIVVFYDKSWSLVHHLSMQKNYFQCLHLLPVSNVFLSRFLF